MCFLAPLGIGLLATVIDSLIDEALPGTIWNVGSKGGMSKADFGERFLRGLGMYDRRIQRVKLAAKENLFPRPLNMIMDSSKLEAINLVEVPYTTEVCDEQIVEYKTILNM